MKTPTGKCNSGIIFATITAMVKGGEEEGEQGGEGRAWERWGGAGKGGEGRRGEVRRGEAR